MDFDPPVDDHEVLNVVVTSNQPFGRWGEVFGDDVVAAMIDRLVHHAEVISLKGDWSTTVRSAAPVSAPGLDALPDREHRNAQCHNGVQPPPSPQRVAQQPHQHGHGEIGAQQILGTLTAGGRRAQPPAQPLLGAAQQWHHDQAGDRQPDAHPAGLWPVNALTAS